MLILLCFTLTRYVAIHVISEDVWFVLNFANFFTKRADSFGNYVINSYTFFSLIGS